MWTYNYTNELTHWGILGMKWGVRRFQNRDGSLTSAGKKRRKDMNNDVDETNTNNSVGKGKSSKGGTTKVTIDVRSKTSKSIKDMSDAELKEKINRLELERRYKDLTKSDQARTNDKGKQFVMDVLEKSGKNIATQATAYAMGVSVNKVAKAFGATENIVDPKNIQKIKK